MKNLAEIDIYEEADLIVEVTTICSKGRKGCEHCPFFKNKIKKRRLNPSIYIKNIRKLEEGGIVALRGGEPTMVHGWFNKYVIPAITMGLIVIVESNGFFINKQLLRKLSHPNLFIRISFDETHLEKMNEDQIEAEFMRMSFFARSALREKVNFGFYYVGETISQINNFIKNTRLKSFLENFYFLTKREDYSNVKIRGKYLSSNGKLCEKIAII